MPCEGTYIYAYERFLLFSSCHVCRQVYLSILYNNKIVKVDLDGQLSTQFLSNLGQPHGIAIDYLHSRVCWTSLGKYKGVIDLQIEIVTTFFFLNHPKISYCYPLFHISDSCS